MTDNNPSTIPAATSKNSYAMNIGIGMLIGLIVALVVAYFAMSSGPFRDKTNKNVLLPANGNTDPNASLYNSSSTAGSTTPTEQAPANEQGTGIGSLLDNKPTESTNAGATESATTESPVAPTHTAPPVEAPASSVVSPKPKEKEKDKDPIGELISKPKEKGNSSNTSAPKPVQPVTAPAPSGSSAGASSSRFTIQAGSFANEAEARALKDKLAGQGQNASISKKHTADGAVYRVRVGSYESAKEAQSANSKIKGVVLDVTP